MYNVNVYLDSFSFYYKIIKYIVNEGQSRTDAKQGTVGSKDKDLFCARLRALSEHVVKIIVLCNERKAPEHPRDEMTRSIITASLVQQSCSRGNFSN